MATDPAEILNQRNAEVAQIRGYADLTEEAKQRRIDEVSARAQEEYQQALEDQERLRAERLEKSKVAVFRVPIPYGATEAEEAQIHAAYRSAYNDVYYSTSFAGSPGEAREKLERLLAQAERSGDKLLAQAAYHRAIDLGIQSVVDSYLSSRPAESKAWERYTEAHQEANQSRDLGFLLERSLTQQGNKEVALLKEEIKALISDVRSGELDRNNAAVMIQGYRALRDFIALERQVRETDELAAEIEELKGEYGVAG